MLTVYPYVLLAGSVRIGIAIFSYAGRITSGTTGDYEGEPDIDVLASGIEKGIADLLAVDTHIKPRFEFMKRAGLARAARIDDAAIPHAFFALSGGAGLIFAVASNCRRLTGLDPRKREVIEAHADFVADLLVR